MSGPRIGALFAGAGGLDLAVQDVLGGSLAWVSEIDPAASKVLAHHHPDVPNLGDIATVDWGQVEPVDILTGGFPCQDLSLAGRRAGLAAGTRSGLWAYMADAIAALRPNLVVIENVRGLLSAHAARGVEPEPPCLGDEPDVPALRALGAVLGDLAELGFDAEWVGLRAADVGACHGRFRVCVLAWPTADARSCGRSGGAQEPLGSSLGRAVVARGGSESAADAAGSGREGRREAGGPAEVGRSSAVGGRPVAGGRGAASHAQGDGRDEGRPEPARLVGGPDAAERGAGAAADADCLGSLRGGPARGRWAGSADDRREPAPDPHSGRRGPDERHLHPGEPDAAGRPAGYPQGVGEPDEPLGRPAAGLQVEPVVGAVHRDRERDPAEGVHELGRAAPVLAWGPYAAAVHRWELTLGRPAPAPTEPGTKGGQRLSPRFVEWMMGLPEGWVTDVPDVSRNDQLRILGNGVVPQQLSAMLSALLDRAFGGRRAA